MSSALRRIPSFMLMTATLLALAVSPLPRSVVDAAPEPAPGADAGTVPGADAGTVPGADDTTAAEATPASQALPAGPVRGIYVQAPALSDDATLAYYLDLLDRTELNALVVDVKSDFGDLTFRAANATAQAAGAVIPYLGDLSRFADAIHAHGGRAIGRLVSFKDQRAVALHPGWAVQSDDGAPWADAGGELWLNPYNRETWTYLVDVAREVAGAGFDEVQFDYVRFPTDGAVEQARYPGQDDRAHRQVISAFLAFAHEQLQPLDVKVSVDVFGLVTTFREDFGTGQYLEELAPDLDVISPMLYPSHWVSGNLGLENPDAQPYETIYRSLTDAKSRLAAAGVVGITVRPWLQDFSLRHDYGKAEVRAQIEATYDAGYDEWLLWNAAGEYTLSALEPKSPPLRPEFLDPREVGPQVSLLLNGRRMASPYGDVLPFVNRGTQRTLVPIRFVAETLGAVVSWESETWTAVVRWRDRVVRLPLGKPGAEINGRAVALDQPAVLWQERTLVPLRLLVEAFGATVTWDGQAMAVGIQLPGAVCQPGYCAE